MITKTPMVFSSMFFSTSSGSNRYRLFSLTGKIRASTSKYRANFSSATCAFEPMMMFGLLLSLPWASRFSCQRRFMAKPPRWIASEEPVVAVPIADSEGWTPQRWARMEMQRACMAIMAGYSSASDILTARH